MTVALYVFALVVIADVAGLILDASLWLSGQPTISGEARRHFWLGLVLIGVQVVGAIALAVHLYW